MDKQNLKQQYEENWYWYLTGKNKAGFSTDYERKIKKLRRVSAFFPGRPRCFECNLPLAGLGSWIMKTKPSSFSPRLCRTCEQVMREVEAGAEVELSLVFADVRGSTRLAEQTSTADYKSLIQRFYRAASGVLIEHNAMVNRLMGDQVIGLFVPRFAGVRHAQVAVHAALDLLRVTGYADPGGPWIPIGAGVHTGLAYVGAVGTRDGVNEIAVLGSAPNLAARLCSQAGEGEVLVSETAAVSAQLTGEGIESRSVELKGMSQPVGVKVLRWGSGVGGVTLS